jgi:hypothetical protein
VFYLSFEFMYVFDDFIRLGLADTLTTRAKWASHSHFFLAGHNVETKNLNTTNDRDNRVLLPPQACVGKEKQEKRDPVRTTKSLRVGEKRDS